MNKIVNKFLLAGDRFMLKLYLRHPGFTYSACDPLLNIMKRFKN